MKTIKINNYELHFIETDKFKDIYVDIKFIGETNYNNNIYLRFLSFLLLNSNSKYNNKDLIKEMKKLYDLKLSCKNKTVGNSYLFSYSAKFLKDEYSETEMKSLEFMLFNLLNPNIKNKKFLDFKEALRFINNALEERKENSDLLSKEECLKNIDVNNPFCYVYDNVNNVVNETVYDFYNEMLESKVDVYIVGNVDEKKYVDFFKNINFKNKKNNSNYIYLYNNIKEQYNITEVKNKLFDQSVLYLGFKIENINEYERFVLFKVYSYILGGTAFSKLFSNIREKHSLAYSCYSHYITYNSILLIQAGIDYSNKDKTIELIKKEIKSKVTIEELELAKKNICLLYENIYDKAFEIIEFYSSNMFYNKTIDEYIDLIKNISLDEINSIKTKLKLCNISITTKDNV